MIKGCVSLCIPGERRKTTYHKTPSNGLTNELESVKLLLIGKHFLVIY